MAKSKSPARSETEVREIVHRYLYKRYQTGRGDYGKHGRCVKIMDMRRELKAEFGLDHKGVGKALLFLIDEEWVKKEEKERMYITPRGTQQPSTVTYYRISSAGITKLEGESEYTKPQVSPVTVNASGQNVITIGDHNVVDARFENQARELIAFENAIASAIDVSDAAKWELTNNVQTIKAQLANPMPDGMVVGRIWRRIEELTTGTTLAANVAGLLTVFAPILNSAIA